MSLRHEKVSPDMRFDKCCPAVQPISLFLWLRSVCCNNRKSGLRKHLFGVYFYNRTVAQCISAYISSNKANNYANGLPETLGESFFNRWSQCQSNHLSFSISPAFAKPTKVNRREHEPRIIRTNGEMRNDGTNDFSRLHKSLILSM